MIDFKDFDAFIESVQSNNINEIKDLLVENIFIQQGDKSNLDKAIEYAMNNSNFKFEEHIELEVSDKKNKEDYFSDEKWNMRKNYSRERYELLVELYGETFTKPEHTYETVEDKAKDKIIRKIIIGGVIVVAGYLIYKAIVNE